MSQSQNKRVERFPNDPIFNQLAFLAAKVRRPVVYDATGLEVDYNQFFHDVSKLRAKLREVLPSFSFDEQGILHEKHPYICLLATGDYDFIVSFYAILALGGAVAPLGKSAHNEFSFDKIQNTDATVSLASGVLPAEAEYFLQKTKSSILLTPGNRITQANAIKEHIREHTGTDITIVTLPHVEKCSSEFDIAIDNNLVFPPTRPVVALFTSGTTSLPKAVVVPRQRFQGSYNINLDGVIMAYRPPHWVGGLRTLILPLLQGNRVYILPNRAGADVFWKYFRDIPFTHLSVTPTTLRQLKDHFEKVLNQLAQGEIDNYLRHLRNLQNITCSSAMVEASTLQFWREILGKDIITNCYATTEAGAVTKTQAGSTLKVSRRSLSIVRFLLTMEHSALNRCTDTVSFY